MAMQPWETVFRQTTREQCPDIELRRRCMDALHKDATRLDALYRLEMEAVSRARAAETVLLGELIQGLRRALPALVSPLVLLDVRAASRPAPLHLRAFLLFGATPHPGVGGKPERTEGLFLLDDTAFLRVRFTGARASTQAGPSAFAADRLEGVDARGLLRDHGLLQVAEALARGIAERTARRRAHLRGARAHLERLESLRVLLRR